MSDSTWPAGPYNLTLDYNVPVALLNTKTCTNIDIEISGLTAEEAESGLQNNMKIVLHFSPTDKVSALSLRAVRGRASDNKGYIVLEPLTEFDPLEATSILRLDLDEGWTVAEILHWLVYANVHHFDFVSRPGKRTYGRRDILTQILRVWEMGQVLKSTNFKVIHGTTTYLDCIYAALCNRFAENTTVFSAIGMCKFTEGYRHEKLDQAHYLE